MNDSYDWHEHVPEHPAKSAMVSLAIYAALIVVREVVPILGEGAGASKRWWAS